MGHQETCTANVYLRLVLKTPFLIKGIAPYSRKHYIEYLVDLINQYEIDCIPIMDSVDLESEIRRNNLSLPKKTNNYVEDCRKVIDSMQSFNVVNLTHFSIVDCQQDSVSLKYTITSKYSITSIQSNRNSIFQILQEHHTIDFGLELRNVVSDKMVETKFK